MLQSLKTAFLSLIISFTILFPVSAYITINIMQNNKNKIETTNEKNKPKITIPKTQDITVLFIISTNKIENNQFDEKLFYLENKKQNMDIEEKYIIIKISPHDNKICFLNIPKNIKTIAQTNEGFPLAEGSLEKIYHTAGTNFLKNSIENLTNIEIDNIINLDYDSIDGILNNLGGIKILKEDKKTYEIINTKKFCEILNKDPKKAFSLLKNSFNKKTNLSNLFATISTLSLTDMTIHDFENRKKGFEEIIKKNNFKKIFPKLDIELKGRKNKLSEKCLEELKEAYK